MTHRNFHRNRVLRGTRALAFADAETLLVSKGYELSLYSIASDKYKNAFSLSTSVRRFAVSFRYAARAMRRGIREAIAVSRSTYLVRCDREILLVDMDQKTATPIRVGEPYHPPLSFCRISGIPDFEDQIVFGEYFKNDSRKAVSVFRRTEKSGWSRAYQFPKGAINHVHRLVPDPIQSGVWILTGDFEHSAALWFAKRDFSSVDLVVGNSQRYRSCFAFPTAEGLFYCTDSPLEANSLSILRKVDSSGKWTAEKLHGLPGPVIFSGETRSGRLFSTSVEPLPSSRSTLRPLLSRSLGPGIASNRTTVWHLSHGGSLELIDEAEKDFLPFLFQFGMRTFPSGGEQSEHLVFFNIATKRNDYCTEIWSIE